MMLLDPQIWLSLVTLTILEIVLGIDNLVFLSIISSSVKPSQQKLARRIGLIAALVMRLALLASIFWLVGLTKPVITVLSHGFSARDLILIGGGLFLLIKSTTEIHGTMAYLQSLTY